jgi:glycosyltransferase involved in cell wall biosynthesis
MKIAYLTSLYPAVSHTFIINEIAALRGLGLEIGTFSVHRAGPQDILGPEAEKEALSTLSILPLPFLEFAKAIAWCFGRRFHALAVALLRGSVMKSGGLKSRLKWSAYTLEAILLSYWLVRGNYEHLHCHFGNSASSTAQIAAKLAGIPLSITCHGSELNSPYLFRLPEKVEQAAFTVCVSKYGRAQLMQVCKRANWHKIAIVRCGLPRSMMSDPPIVLGGGVEILCVGRLSQEKGHFVLLAAFELLQLRKIMAQLTIVGDGPLRSELEDRCQYLPIPNAVHFTGSLDPASVSRLFQACSLVVLSSFSEGVPVVLMEAFAHGRPVVATRVGGVPELVENGVSGFVVSPGDPEELANAMERIISDPVLAKIMGKNGSKKVVEEFDESISAKKLKSLFENSGRLR